MDIIEHLREEFEKEKFASGMGIELVDLKPGYSQVKLEVDESHTNIFGYTHGGVVFSLLDAAFELACNSHGKVSVALSMNVNFTTPAKPGDTLKAEAEEANLTRSTGLYDIRVRNHEDQLIASCSALAYRLDKDIG